MYKIFKYKIKTERNFSLELPLIHTFLKLDVQNGTPFLWILIDTNSNEGTFCFEIYGTGWEIEKDSLAKKKINYIDTFQLDSYVWHLFGWKGLNES